MNFRFEVIDADGMPEHEAQTVAGLMLIVDGMKRGGLTFQDAEQRYGAALALLWSDPENPNVH